MCVCACVHVCYCAAFVQYLAFRDFFYPASCWSGATRKTLSEGSNLNIIFDLSEKAYQSVQFHIGYFCTTA